MIERIKNWLDQGEGGDFYESYVTNRDVLVIMGTVLLISSIMIFAISLV